MAKYKLKWRIFSFLIGFCALLIVILWIFQTTLLNSTYEWVRRREIKSAIAQVEKEINNIPKLKILIEQLANEKEIFVDNYNPNDDYNLDIAFSTGPGGRGFLTRVNPFEITKVRSFTLENGSTVSLIFYALTTPVEATVSTLKIQLYIITIILIMLATTLSVIIAKKIASPIERLNNSAKVLAENNYNVSFSGHGFLEIEELSKTLNTAATELAKVDKFRKELMANISHDLRTPLALIYSYAEMMHDFPNEVTNEQTELIMAETTRLNSLVNDVLDMSRIEQGTIKINKTTYNLTTSLQQTVTRVYELVKKDNYKLVFHADEQEAIITADEIKINQAFYNLLINAINYSTNNKTIHIRQIITNNQVKIEIEDHGIGIDQKDLQYIWDRYYKVDKNHKRAIMGSGIGLSIVKKIIDLHNGNYGVISEKEKGSIFWFALKMPPN